MLALSVVAYQVTTNTASFCHPHFFVDQESGCSVAVDLLRVSQRYTTVLVACTPFWNWSVFFCITWLLAEFI
jgi:hypothetical protein